MWEVDQARLVNRTTATRRSLDRDLVDVETKGEATWLRN